MRASDAANRPRWSGQVGFFEIWFLVVFEAAARRAWWSKHIWGTRRVEELYWLYCPRFDEEVAACLEATAVRPRRRPGAPRLVPIWFRTARRRLHPLAAWRPPRRLTCSEGAALELHAPEPLPGVRYLGWDATELE